MATDTDTAPAQTHAVVLDALRDRQQKVWSSGDYNKIAALTVPVAETLVTETGIRPGARVLDVATGTGHAALAASRQGARASGLDYVPALVGIARARAAAEQLDLDLTDGVAEQLPYPDGSFDVVLSAIGVMFAADHQRAAAELVRVTRPGGQIGLASWTPSGFVGGMFGIVGRHVPPPAVTQSPLRWGTTETVADLLGAGVTDVRSTVHSVTQRFTDAAAFVDLFLAYYGPTHTAAASLSPEGRATLRADLLAHAVASARPDAPRDHLVLDWEYLVVHASRRQ
ncbi:class I SAM-dependent methyltransferase [Actinotalea sp. K2]|uniref:class I SAM-dependent methyltransferase n=1 Tax=Actinotalea sp. K2 TaxID=2939438 RepID=UPI002016E5C6|nr:methyltransferase domain-containing protein [Actinotalea sp. K2]MCL3860683.1 class I SAM-dependent methyltransferase [Actinotalea sp. K2]